MNKFVEDLKKRLKENWKFLTVGIALFLILVIANNIFDYSSYTSEIKYNNTIEGGRTPQITRAELKLNKILLPKKITYAELEFILLCQVLVQSQL